MNLRFPPPVVTHLADMPAGVGTGLGLSMVFGFVKNGSNALWTATDDLFPHLRKLARIDWDTLNREEVRDTSESIEYAANPMLRWAFKNHLVRLPAHKYPLETLVTKDRPILKTLEIVRIR